MKIESIRIENFRIFKDETINFSDYNCLVGPNGTGKSTVIYALNVFFQETFYGKPLTELVEEDFHVKITKDPVKITITFIDLSDSAKEDLRHYVRHNKLIVTAEANYDPAKEKAIVKQYGTRMVMTAFRKFFELHDTTGVKVEELRNCYKQIQKDFPDLPNINTKTGMYEALRKYEEIHKELCQPVPSEDQFYGFTKGKNHLSPYIQWIFIPAVKEASEEQLEARNTALGKILQRTVRTEVDFSEHIKHLRDNTREAYQQIIDNQKDILKTISTKLTKRMIEWAHPSASLELEWMQDPEKGVSITEPYAEVVASEGLFEGNISRFGHGFKRSYLFALLQVLSEIEDTSASTMLLACEEPELYQHPPQAKHLSSVLQKLSEQSAQIIICTHSPLFIHGDRIEGIRKFRLGNDGASIVNQIDIDQLVTKLKKIGCLYENTTSIALLPKLHQELQPQVNEIFFTPVLILVEGLEDIAYLKTHLFMTKKWEEFQRYGCYIVPVNGKSNLIKPLAVAQLMDIPTFFIFDADSNETNNDKRIKHQIDNEKLLRLNGSLHPVPFPPETIYSDNMVMWSTNIADSVSADYAKAEWEECKQEALKKYLHMKNSDKNIMVIADKLEMLYNKYGLSKTLDVVCDKIIEYAKKQLPQLKKNI